MLKNAYFLAKFRFDTAENEPAKNLQNVANFPNLVTLTPRAGRRVARGGLARRDLRVELRDLAPHAGALRHRGLAPAPPRGPADREGALELAGNVWQHFYNCFCKFLVGSFSDVLKSIIPSKYAFGSIFKLYKMCTLLHGSKLNILATCINRFNTQQIL